MTSEQIKLLELLGANTKGSYTIQDNIPTFVTDEAKEYASYVALERGKYRDDQIVLNAELIRKGKRSSLIDHAKFSKLFKQLSKDILNSPVLHKRRCPTCKQWMPE